MPPPDDQEQLVASLQAMATSMGSTNSIMDKLLVAQTQTNTLIKDMNGDLGEGEVQTIKNTALVGKAVRFIGNQITGAIRSAFKMQEKSLSVGLTFAEMMDKNAEVTGYLTEGLTGFQTAQTIGTEMFVAGLRGNNKEIARLAVATKLTGGDSRKLLKGMAGLTAGMGFSDEQRSSLANTALSLSQQFGMSTDQLVGALGALADQMDIYAALDIAPELQEGMLSLQAALGPELADAGVKFANEMLKPEAMIQASLMGVAQERRLIGQEINVAENLIKMVIKSGEFARRQSEVWKGGVDPLFNLGEMGKVYGKNLLTSKRLLDKMEENSKRDGMNIEERMKEIENQRAIDKKFTETWNNFKELVLSPLMEMSNTVGTWILKTGNILGDTVTPIIKSLVAVAGILVAAKGALGILGIGAGGGILAGLGTGVMASVAGAILPILGVTAAIGGAAWGLNKLFSSDESDTGSNIAMAGGLSTASTFTPDNLNTEDNFDRRGAWEKINDAIGKNSDTLSISDSWEKMSAAMDRNTAINQKILDNTEVQVEQGDQQMEQRARNHQENKPRPGELRTGVK